MNKSNTTFLERLEHMSLKEMLAGAARKAVTPVQPTIVLPAISEGTPAVRIVLTETDIFDPRCDQHLIHGGTRADQQAAIRLHPEARFIVLNDSIAMCVKCRKGSLITLIRHKNGCLACDK